MGISSEQKLDMVLEKLSHIEQLLTIGEDFPEQDELDAVRDYMERKKKGNLELVDWRRSKFP